MKLEVQRDTQEGSRRNITLVHQRDPSERVSLTSRNQQLTIFTLHPALLVFLYSYSSLTHWGSIAHFDLSNSELQQREIMTNYDKLKVTELREMLQERNLAQTGNKPDLIKRLQENDKEKEAGGGGAAAGETKGTFTPPSCLSFFLCTAVPVPKAKENQLLTS